jgi:hypothetical protein
MNEPEETFAQRRARKDREHALGEHHVQVGMRAIIRDIQEWVVLNRWEEFPGLVVSADKLNAYLLALLITAGGFDDEGLPGAQDLTAQA